MATTKVKIEKELVEKAKKYAELAGYSTVEEFVEHVLQKEIAQFESADSDEEVRKRLQGLGYIS